MQAWLGGVGCGVALVFASSQAFGWSCPGHLDAPDPAPPDVALLSVQECCQVSPLMTTTGEFVPVTGQDVPDASREPVPVSFSDERGLRVGRGNRALEPGNWRYVPSETGQASRAVTFTVEQELEGAVAPAAELDGAEAVSNRFVDGMAEQEVLEAYVQFDVVTDASVVFLEVYSVTGGERSAEPVAEGSTSYEQVLIGQSYNDCQGRYVVSPSATYDVRAAAYAKNGELGEWSEFERIEVPALPESEPAEPSEPDPAEPSEPEPTEPSEPEGASAGCAHSPRATVGAGWAWLLAVAAVAWCLRRDSTGAV